MRYNLHYQTWYEVVEMIATCEILEKLFFANFELILILIQFPIKMNQFIVLEKEQLKPNLQLWIWIPIE